MTKQVFDPGKTQSPIGPDSYGDGSYWQTHDTFHEEDAAFKVANFLKTLQQLGQAPKVETVIDVGCGSGEFLRLLASQMSGEFLGIDLAEAAIARARQRSGEDRPVFLRSSFTEINDVYDLAILNDVFEHVDDYIGFLRSVRSVASLHYFHVPLEMTVRSSAGIGTWPPGVDSATCTTSRETLRSSRSSTAVTRSSHTA